MPAANFLSKNHEVEILFCSSKPVTTIDLLLRKSGLSLRTLRRRMKSCNVMSSYNANSSFYTLPIFAKFNSYGLWHYENASFSTRGTLSATIKSLINRSPAGHTAAEMSEILCVKTDDFLRIMSERHEISKERLAFRNIYISSDKEFSRTQISNRKQMLSETVPATPKLPRLAERIMILSEIILTKKLIVDVGDISRRLKEKGFALNSDQIDNVISHYGVKKTQP